MTSNIQTFLNEVISTNLKVDDIYGPKTFDAEFLFRKKLFNILHDKNYKSIEYFILGIRMNNQYTNTFDDWGVIILPGGFIPFRMSTSPGYYYIMNLINKKGVANVVPDEYIDLWEAVGLDSNDYDLLWSNLPYLKQVNPISVYRDSNKDYLESTEIIEKGFFGINFHSWKNFLSRFVGKLSAGCQVVDKTTLFQILPYLRTIFKFKKRVNYVLLEKKDFN